MRTKRATHFFNVAPTDYNCAQAILKCFQSELKIPEEVVTQFKAYGSGKAPGAVCGALYAGNHIMMMLKKEPLDAEFELKVSQKCCDTIRESNTPCIRCIELVEKLIEHRMDSDQ